MSRMAFSHAEQMSSPGRSQPAHLVGEINSRAASISAPTEPQPVFSTPFPTDVKKPLPADAGRGSTSDVDAA